MKSLKCNPPNRAIKDPNGWGIRGGCQNVFPVSGSSKKETARNTSKFDSESCHERKDQRRVVGCSLVEGKSFRSLPPEIWAGLDAISSTAKYGKRHRPLCGRTETSRGVHCSQRDGQALGKLCRWKVIDCGAGRTRGSTGFAHGNIRQSQ